MPGLDLLLIAMAYWPKGLGSGPSPGLAAARRLGAWSRRPRG